jgi:Carboxypeptidase regulatory-like domain
MRSTLLFLLAFGSLSMAQQSSAVFGVVRNTQTQQPIEGATVQLAPYALSLPDPLFSSLKLVSDSFIGFQTTTDASGRYRLSDLPPHRYCLAVQKQGYWLTDDDMCQLSMIRLGVGTDLERLTLDRAPTLKGRFIDSSTNAPITGLRLIAVRHMFAGGMQQWTTSFGMKPGQGAGEFEMLPPRGEFYLEIVPDNNEKIAVRGEQGVSSLPFYGRSYYPGVTDIAMATPIVLAPGEHRFRDIRLSKQAPKTVTIDIAGVPSDAKIELALERRSVGYFPPTVAKASAYAKDPIQIRGLSATEYILTAWTKDIGAGRKGLVRRFRPENLNASQLKLDLAPTSTIHGIVQLDASPAPQAIGDWSYSMKSDDRENPGEGYSAIQIKAPEPFSVGGLFPGKYQVYASAPPGWVVSKMKYGMLDAIHQTFTLDTTSSMVVTLSRQFGTVTGSLTDANGPMDNAMVVLMPEPMPEDPYVSSFPWAHLDEKGGYEFRYVAAGHYRVVPFYGDTLGLYHDARAFREHARGYRDVDVLPGKTCTGVNFASRQYRKPLQARWISERAWRLGRLHARRFPPRSR